MVWRYNWQTQNIREVSHASVALLVWSKEHIRTPLSLSIAIFIHNSGKKYQLDCRNVVQLFWQGCLTSSSTWYFERSKLLSIWQMFVRDASCLTTRIEIWNLVMTPGCTCHGGDVLLRKTLPILNYYCFPCPLLLNFDSDCTMFDVSNFTYLFLILWNNSRVRLVTCSFFEVCLICDVIIMSNGHWLNEYWQSANKTFLTKEIRNVEIVLLLIGLRVDTL